MTKFISERDFSIPVLSDFIDQQGINASIDGDGDVYVSDHKLGFPFWLTIDRAQRVLVFYTYKDYSSDEAASDALESAYRIRLGPLTPQFSLSETTLYAHYFMPFRDGIVGAHIYETACRFAEYFSHTRPFTTKDPERPTTLH